MGLAGNKTGTVNANTFPLWHSTVANGVSQTPTGTCGALSGVCYFFLDQSNGNITTLRSFHRRAA